MPKILGELQDACLEHLSSDPGSSVSGRIYTNTTEARIKTDDGTNKRALLRNDLKAVIGNSGTDSENIRLHRGAAGVIQLLEGDDATAEGSLSSSINQLSARLENYLEAGKPAAGNAGRSIYITDEQRINVDNGTTWDVVGPNPTTTKGDLLVHDGSVDIRQPVGANGLFLKANSSLPSGLEWASGSANKAVRSVVTTDTATSADDILVLSGASFTQTLFTPVGNSGKIIEIIHSGTNLSQVYTISGTGLGTYALYTNGERVKLVSDNTNWLVLDHSAKTDWIAFPSVAAGTLITAVTSDPSYGNSGSPVTNAAYWKRSGSDVLIRWDYRHTNTTGSAAGSGIYLFNLPSGLTMDTNFVTVNTETSPGGDNSDSGSLGRWTAAYSTDAFVDGMVSAYSTTELKVLGKTTNGTSSSTSTWDSGFIAFNDNAAQSYHLEARLPITGWKS